MIRHICILSAVIQLLSLPEVVAQPNDSVVARSDRRPLLSGFVDVRGVYSSDPDKTSKFSIGQTELDLEQTGFAVRNWSGFAGRTQDGDSLRDNPSAELRGSWNGADCGRVLISCRNSCFTLEHVDENFDSSDQFEPGAKHRRGTRLYVDNFMEFLKARESVRIK